MASERDEALARLNAHWKANKDEMNKGLRNKLVHFGLVPERVEKKLVYLTGTVMTAEKKVESGIYTLKVYPPVEVFLGSLQARAGRGYLQDIVDRHAELFHAWIQAHKSVVGIVIDVQLMFEENEWFLSFVQVGFPPRPAFAESCTCGRHLKREDQTHE